MAQNTLPVFGKTPLISGVNITSTGILTGSLGAGAIGTNQFVAFTAGNSGSYVQKVRFMNAASTASLTGVATVLRAHYSTVNSGTPTTGQIYLLGEISVGALTPSSATQATNFYELPLNFAMPAGSFLLVSQHTAQTTNTNWQAFVIASDYV